MYNIRQNEKSLEQTGLAMLQVGGFAIVTHGGDELSEWAILAALRPDEAAARDFVQERIGAYSLAESLENRERLNDVVGYEKFQANHWASVHALSPQLYAAFAEAWKPQNGRCLHELAHSILEDFQHPSYAVDQHTVLCTEREAEDLLYAQRPPLYEGDPSEDAAEALADAMNDATHPMHEEYYEAEEEAFARRYDREQFGQARAARSKTAAPE